MSRKPSKPLPRPSLLLHKKSGRAYVMGRDADGDRRAVFLGEYGSPEAQRAYQRFLSDFYAGRPAGKPKPPEAARAGDFTVEQLCTQFLVHAESRYRRPDGTVTQEPLNFAHAFRHLLDLFRDVAAAEFDVLMLDAVRMAMIRDDLARTVVNSRVGRIRRAFAWAASRKLMGRNYGQQWAELTTLKALQPGEHGVRESDKIPPVPQAELDEILPHLAAPVRAMVELQARTGCRPGEVAGMRMSMIDRSDPEAWIYRPANHKTSWRGHDRSIPLLPDDQDLLRPFLRLDDRPLFSPRDAEKDRGRDNPHEAIGDAYNAHSYAKAIARGVQAANAARLRAKLLELLRDQLTDGARERIERLSVRKLVANSGAIRADVAKVLVTFTGRGQLLERLAAELAALPLLEPFGPNRIRHLAATRAADVAGDEAAQLLLGHADGRTLKHYVQRSARRVVDIRRRLLSS